MTWKFGDIAALIGYARETRLLVLGAGTADGIVTDEGTAASEGDYVVLVIRKDAPMGTEREWSSWYHDYWPLRGTAVAHESDLVSPE